VGSGCAKESKTNLFETTLGQNKRGAPKTGLYNLLQKGYLTFEKLVHVRLAGRDGYWGIGGEVKRGTFYIHRRVKSLRLARDSRGCGYAGLRKNMG